MHDESKSGNPQETDVKQPYVQDYKGGAFIEPHVHPEFQLLFAVSGVMRVTTKEGVWIVPPQRAVWIPGNTWHSIQMHNNVSMRSVYFSPGELLLLEKPLQIIAVSRLMRELVLAITETRDIRGEEMLALVHLLILHELINCPQLPLSVPTVRDSRLRRIERALSTDPGDNRTLAEWCKEAHASVRTISRLLSTETGMSFGHWRQQIRLIRAVEMLADGEPVTNIAHALGYNSHSAFTSMFRSALGVVPSRYFDNQQIN